MRSGFRFLFSLRHWKRFECKWLVHTSADTADDSDDDNDNDNDTHPRFHHHRHYQDDDG